jgi:hypothetical protein
VRISRENHEFGPSIISSDIAQYIHWKWDVRPIDTVDLKTIELILYESIINIMIKINNILDRCILNEHQRDFSCEHWSTRLQILEIDIMLDIFKYYVDEPL